MDVGKWSKFSINWTYVKEVYIVKRVIPHRMTIQAWKPVSKSLDMLQLFLLHHTAGRCHLL